MAEPDIQRAPLPPPQMDREMLDLIIREMLTPKTYSEGENAPAPDVYEGGNLPPPGDIEAIIRGMQPRRDPSFDAIMQEFTPPTEQET